MTKDISIDQIIETIKGKIPQSGVVASILSAAMGAALATKILEALKYPDTKKLTDACATLQSITKRGQSELTAPELIELARAALISLQTIESAMNSAPTPLRPELLVGAMCSWTGLEGTLAMAESMLRLKDSPDADKLTTEIGALRTEGKKAGRSAEELGKNKPVNKK